MKTWHKVLIVALGVAAAKAPAHAQYDNPYTGTTWNNPMSSYLDTVNMGNQQMAEMLARDDYNRSDSKRSTKGRKAKSKARGSKTTGHSAPTTPTAAPVKDAFQSAVKVTSFKYSGTSVMPQKLSQMLSSKAEERSKKARILGECLQSVRADFLKNTRSNLPTDNVARALAYSLMSWYGLAQTRNGEKMGQRVPDISQAQADALRVQIALALSADPKFRAKTNRQKQESYEVLMIMSGLAEAVYGIGLQQNNVKMQESARDMARDNLKELLGVKAEKMRFTETGVQF